MLKISLSIVFLVIVSSSLCLSQTTYLPIVEAANYPNCKIVSITIDDKKTTVILEYEKTESNRSQSWVSFGKYIVLSDYYNAKDSYLIQSLGDAELETKYATTGKKGDKYNFALIFPKLPSGLKKINIKEIIPEGNGFEWRGINITNPDKSQNTEWTEKSLKKHWEDNGSDDVEGVYENTITDERAPKYRVAIKKNQSGYDIIYLSGADSDFSRKWTEGAIKGSLIPTAKENFFKAKWVMSNKTVNENLYVTIGDAIMKIIWTENSPEQLYLKLYPSHSTSNSNSSKSSGTGFALSSNGLIVTNYHVIDGAKNISIKGVNGNFSLKLNAKVVVSDRNNDLAILQISDPNFNTISNVPYAIKLSASDVGENVFVLGYPLRSTMGEEIKLTTGIISSKTGFQGDITSYQVSAPIQPGNSGGPLFDNNSNLIGVINAKLKGGENVSYAVKVSYLKNLIDALPVAPTLNNSVSLSSASLSEKVKVLNNYVYIIEIN